MEHSLGAVCVCVLSNKQMIVFSQDVYSMCFESLDFHQAITARNDDFFQNDLFLSGLLQKNTKLMI